MQSITHKEPVERLTISHLDVLQSIIPVKKKKKNEVWCLGVTVIPARSVRETNKSTQVE